MPFLGYVSVIVALSFDVIARQRSVIIALSLVVFARICSFIPFFFLLNPFLSSVLSLWLFLLARLEGYVLSL